MDIKQLQYFVTSTDCGSFKKAADLLYTSQPHISKCIKSLEDELQIELLRRKARGVELTEAGKAVYYTARKMLKDAEKISSIQQTQNTRVLSIGCQTSDYLIHSIIDYVQTLQKNDITICYTEGELSNLMAELNHRHIDLAFVCVNHSMLTAFNQKLESRHLKFYPLFQKKLELLVGPANPYFNSSSITEKELKNLRFIQFEEDADFFRKDSSVPLMTNDPFSGLTYPIRTNSRQLITNLLLTTDYSLLNCSIEPKLNGDSRIHSIPLETNRVKYTFGYIQNARESLSQPAQDFLLHVKQLIFRD